MRAYKLDDAIWNEKIHVYDDKKQQMIALLLKFSLSSKMHWAMDEFQVSRNGKHEPH